MALRLAEFIHAEIEPILQNWEEFAETLLSAKELDKTELRDHAEKILLDIADDLHSSQTNAEQAEKSKGRGPESGRKPSSKAHGAERLRAGFGMLETVSEFRALRASVESLWTQTHPAISGELLEDLTRFHEAIDQALAESMEEFARLKDKDTRLFGSVLTASPDPIFVLDAKGRFRYANKATAEHFDLDPDTLIGQSIFDLEFASPQGFRRRLKQVIAEHSTYRGRFFHPIASRPDEIFDFILAPVLDEHQSIEATVCVARDITQQVRAEDKIWHSAHHDELTGLPNRRLFLDRLTQEVKHAKRNNLSLSVLFMDLNGFKEVNDAFGHEAGDRLLCTVADRLIGCVREEDTVARMGGDEFTVMLTGVDQPKDAKLVAQSIIDAIAMPFEIAQRSVYVSASIGISCYLEDTTSPEELLKAADDAMYKAKKSQSGVYLAA